MSVKDCLPHKMQHAVLAAAEKGASSWLPALPLADFGFSLSKSDFRDIYIYVMFGPHPDYQPLVFVANLFTSTMLYPARREGLLGTPARGTGPAWGGGGVSEERLPRAGPEAS